MLEKRAAFIALEYYSIQGDGEFQFLVVLDKCDTIEEAAKKIIEKAMNCYLPFMDSSEIFIMDPVSREWFSLDLDLVDFVCEDLESVQWDAVCANFESDAKECLLVALGLIK